MHTRLIVTNQQYFRTRKMPRLTWCFRFWASIPLSNAIKENTRNNRLDVCHVNALQAELIGGRLCNTATKIEGFTMMGNGWAHFDAVNSIFKTPHIWTFFFLFFFPTIWGRHFPTLALSRPVTVNSINSHEVSSHQWNPSNLLFNEAVADFKYIALARSYRVKWQTLYRRHLDSISSI